MVRNTRAVITVTVIFLVVQIAIIFALASQDRPDHVRSVMLTTGLLAVYTFLEVRYGFYMNNFVRVMAMLTIFLDALFGSYFDLYATSVIFDKILHVIGTYSFALFAYVLVTQMLKNPIGKPVKFILAVCLGLSLGGVYEIFEFLTDSLSHPTPPSQPSLLDTNLDLIGDTAGALLAAAHVISVNFVNREF